MDILRLWLPPAPLPVVSLHGCGGVLASNEWIAVVTEPNSLAGLFTDLGQFCGGIFDAPSPVDGRHAPNEVGMAAVGTAAGMVDVLIDQRLRGRFLPFSKD